MTTWLMSLSLPVLTAMQTQAAAAYQQLVTGTQVKVFTDQNGQHVEYTAVSASALRDYVEEIGIVIASKQNLPNRQFTRPMRFFF